MRQKRSFPDNWPCIRTGQWKVLTVFPVFGTDSDVRLPLLTCGVASSGFVILRDPSHSPRLEVSWTLSKKLNFRDLLEAAPDAMVGVEQGARSGLSIAIRNRCSA